MDDAPTKEILDTRMVTIAVRAQDRTFTEEEAPTRTYRVPAFQICAVSEYFKKALQSPYKESRTQKFSLYDVPHYAFDAFLLWMACGSILPAPQPDTSSVLYDENADLHDAILLVDLYLLGDYICSKSLKNAVIEDLFQRGKDGMAKYGGTRGDLTELTYRIHSRTLKGDSLRRVTMLLIAQNAIINQKTVRGRLDDKEFEEEFWEAAKILSVPVEWPASVEPFLA